MKRTLHLSPWIRRLAVAAAVVALLLGALPEAIRWGAVRWLDRHGVAATIDDVDLNLFTATAAVAGVSLGDPALRVARVAVVGSWRDLLSRRLRLERVEAEGVAIDAARDAEGGWRIAGIALPAPEIATGEEGEEEAPASPPWGLGVDAVELRDVHLHYRDPVAAHAITLHHAHLGPLATWTPEVAAPLALAAEVDGGKLTIDGKITPFASEPGATVSVVLDHLPLARVAPLVAAVDRLDGDLSTHLQVAAHKGSGGLAATVEGTATVTGLSVRPVVIGATVAAGSVGWKGTMTIGGEAGVAATGDVTTLDVSLDPRDDGAPPVTVAEASLTGIQVAGPHNLAADHLRLAGLELEVVRAADGSVPLVAALKPQQEPAAASPTTAAGATAATTKVAPLHLRLGGVELTGGSRIEVKDRAVDPPFALTLAPIALTLGPLDTARPEVATPLRLRAQAGKYATLTADGAVAPLAPQVAATVEAALKQIDLAPLTGYTARAVGYRLKSGHLDADLTVKVEGGRLDAQTRWQVNKLEMERLKRVKGDPLSDRLGIPVNTALSLLRDRDDNIRLDVPITGPLAEAKVGLGAALRQVTAKATVKAVKTAVLHYLAPLSSPLGLALAAGKLVSLATALHFDPIPFPPGDATLPPSAAPYLDRLAARLADRPRLRLTLCGLATRSDLPVSEEPTEEAGEGEASTTPAETTDGADVDEPEPSPAEGGPVAVEARGSALLPPLTDDQRATLRALATARGAAVKAALVARTIDPDRLFTCSPEIDPGPAAEPRVEVSL